MWKKFRQFMTDLAPPQERRDYMTRRAEIEAARMRLRDEFAMAALTSMLSTPQDIVSDTPRLVSELAYEFADAMLEARETDK